MRSNHNTSLSSHRSAGAKLDLPQVPVQWLDSGSWRLPSGKALAEFALQSGFLAPLLFRVERSHSQAQASAPGEAGAPASGKGGRH
jgi:hypothetical protein